MRPRLVPILCLLAAGAVINVALAWSLSLLTGFASAEPLELYQRVSDDHHWTVHRWNQAAGTRIVSRTWHGFGGGPYREGTPTFLLAGWGAIEIPVAGSPVDITQLDEAWGFPMRAFSCGTALLSRPGSSSVHTTTGIWSLGNPPAGSNRPRYVPVNPLWLGIAVNTVLYTLVAMVLAAAGRDLYRLARRNRVAVATPAGTAGGSDTSPYTS